MKNIIVHLTTLMFSSIDWSNIFDNFLLYHLKHPYHKRISKAYLINQSLSITTLSAPYSSKIHVFMLYNPSQIIINYPSNTKKILKGNETKRDEVNMLYSIKKHLKTIKREDL
jgi:hypothetical protein